MSDTEMHVLSWLKARYSRPDRSPLRHRRLVMATALLRLRQTYMAHIWIKMQKRVVIWMDAVSFWAPPKRARAFVGQIAWYECHPTSMRALN